jgi:hypothetical protein
MDNEKKTKNLELFIFRKKNYYKVIKLSNELKPAFNYYILTT